MSALYCKVTDYSVMACFSIPVISDRAHLGLKIYMGVYAFLSVMDEKEL